MSSPSMHECRSTSNGYPRQSFPRSPSVGIAVAIYNEADHIEQLLKDVLSQDYEELREIWLVDGGSDDGTLEMLQGIQSQDPRLRLIENPKRSTASGVNMAFKAMTTDIVMRIDAHAHYAPDMVRHCVSTLLRTGAGGVGAIARPVDATTLVGQAIVAAHESPFGVGVAKFRRNGAEGWVDTIWNGCYWKHIVDQVGPLREDLPRAEDNDFNERVRRLGYGLYLTPEIRAYYQPRQTLSALWMQYFTTGMGIARALTENRKAVSLRHLAPAAFVVAWVFPLLLSLRWPSFALLTLSLLFVYFGGMLVAIGISARSRTGSHLLLLPLALLTLHMSYGFGTLWGFCNASKRQGTSKRAIREARVKIRPR